MSSVSTVDGKGKYKKNMKAWILIFRCDLGLGLVCGKIATCFKNI